MSQSFVPADIVGKIIVSSTETAVDIVTLVFTTFWTFLQPYFPYAIGTLFVLLITASVKAMLGQTGMLGSLLYHIFYFAILGIIIWIKGFEILFNPVFDLIVLVTYRICYWLTGLILDKFRR